MQFRNFISMPRPSALCRRDGRLERLKVADLGPMPPDI
jgi:hypothetical protein